jgi:hypothetical protein
MAVITTYYQGGFNPAAPAQNRAESYDGPSASYTSWDQSGAQTSQRPLSTAEVTALAGQDVAVATANNAQTLKVRANAAVAANTAFLAVPAPTNVQVLAQVQLLTKQCTALIKLTLSALADTSGT